MITDIRLVTAAMERNLEKERKQFLKRANSAVPPVAPPTKKYSSEKQTLLAAFESNIALTDQEGDHSRFALLRKIVNYLKERRLKGDLHPLSMGEILEELALKRELKSDINWLEFEALPQNPKVRVTSEGKFYFMPKFDIHDRTELYQLLKQFEIKGMGGIEYEDIAESIANPDKVIKSLGNWVYETSDPKTHKRIIFFNDPTFDMQVDDKFKELWRSTSVQGVSEKKIMEHLEKNGLIPTYFGDNNEASTQPTAAEPAKKKRKLSSKRPRARNTVRFNEHVKDVLMEYPDK